MSLKPRFFAGDLIWKGSNAWNIILLNHCSSDLGGCLSGFLWEFAIDSQVNRPSDLQATIK